MFYSELKAKLIEGMTTSVMSYGFDFQVDVVDGDDQFDDDQRLSFKMDRITKHHNEYQFDKHEKRFTKEQIEKFNNYATEAMDIYDQFVSILSNHKL